MINLVGSSKNFLNRPLNNGLGRVGQNELRSGFYPTWPDPFLISISLSLGFAEKRCTENGTWYLDPIRHSEWTNFTTCSQTDVHLTQEYVHVILYGFSVIALTPAIIIFFAYKYVSDYFSSTLRNNFWGWIM